MNKSMNIKLVNWLVTIAAISTLSACGGGAGGSGDSNTSTATGRISDTGQTQCYYDYTNDGIYNPVASYCVPAGSAWSPDGQDGNFTINAMSFTDKGDGTIIDNITGLTWQKCAIGQGGSSCIAVLTTALNWNDAKIQCASLGIGWRLPTILELTGIIDYGKSFVTIDTTSFPGTAPAAYWSSTSNPYYTTLAWRVNFSQGDTTLDYQTNTAYARCVRG